MEISITDVLHVLGKKHSLKIMKVTYSERLSFSRLRYRLPDVSNKVLIEHLRELERVGIIKKTKDTGNKFNRSFYGLTTFGHVCFRRIAMIEGDIR